MIDTPVQRADLADTHAVHSFANYVEERRIGGAGRSKSVITKASICRPSVHNKPSVIRANQ